MHPSKFLFPGDGPSFNSMNDASDTDSDRPMPVAIYEYIYISSNCLNYKMVNIFQIPIDNWAPCLTCCSTFTTDGKWTRPS